MNSNGSFGHWLAQRPTLRQRLVGAAGRGEQLGLAVAGFRTVRVEAQQFQFDVRQLHGKSGSPIPSSP